MLNTIKFASLEALLIDFIDSQDGFLYLRMVGAETIIGAIWAKLSGKEGRGKKWTSDVTIPIPGRQYPDHIAAQKGVTYKTIRTRLPSGYVDLAMIHPLLTVAEDSPKGFYLLSYEDGMPANFFGRLNKALSIPLKPEWAEWLWKEGLEQRTVQSIKVEEAYYSKDKGKEKVVIDYVTPISVKTGNGEVNCYAIKTAGNYKIAWLDIIREQLKLSVKLDKEGPGRYVNGHYTVEDEAGKWTLFHNNERVIEDQPALDHLLIKAQNELGVYMTIRKN